jgi:hypothetical protein
MMSLWESSLSSLNPKYWVAGYQANRYGLEKIGMTGVFRSYGETFEKCSILFKVKSKIPDFDPGEGENSNHRNTLKYFED